jgi:hypothetical protein
VYFLRHNKDYITQMEKSYNNIDGFGDEYSSPPNEISIGHITGKLQEHILSTRKKSHTFMGFAFGI